MGNKPEIKNLKQKMFFNSGLYGRDLLGSPFRQSYQPRAQFAPAYNYYDRVEETDRDCNCQECQERQEREYIRDLQREKQRRRRQPKPNSTLPHQTRLPQPEVGRNSEKSAAEVKTKVPVKKPKLSKPKAETQKKKRSSKTSVTEIPIQRKSEPIELKMEKMQIGSRRFLTEEEPILIELDQPLEQQIETENLTVDEEIIIEPDL